MLTDRAEGLTRLCRTVRYICVAVTCLLTTILTASPRVTLADAVRQALIPTTVVTLALLAFGPSWYAWGRTFFRRPTRTAIANTLVESAIVGLSLVALRLMLPSVGVRPLPAYATQLTTSITLLLCNRILPTALATVLFRSERRQRILILGPEGVEPAIRRQLNVARALGLDVIGSPASISRSSGPRLFRPEDGSDTASGICVHSRILHPQEPDAVDRVVLIREDDGLAADPLQQEIEQQCHAIGLPLTVYTLQQPPAHRGTMPLPVRGTAFCPKPQEPLQNPLNQVWKRTIDILVAVPFVAVVLPPLCLLVAWIHRRQSPGPLFYRQERCGQHGTRFHILKFRTMHAPAPGETDLEDNPAPRIFPLGQLLRDSRLDEIPQFVNVLMGSMSVVGPRAHHVQDRSRFSSLVSHYPMRMQAKPGITGLAQYREYRKVFQSSCVASRVESDMQYINQWSLRFDLILMFKTGRVIGESLFRAAWSKLRPAPPAATTLPMAGSENAASRSESRQAA